MSDSTRLAMHGAGGRMGRAIIGLVPQTEGVTLGQAFERDGSDLIGRDAFELAGVSQRGVQIQAADAPVEGVDVVIDFSSAAATASLAPRAAAAGAALVVGTTGLDEAAMSALREAESKVPVLVAANTSVGVAVLFHLAELASGLLGPDYDAEIVEMHHRHKIDAPSGTALRLAERVRAARGLPASAEVHGRTGTPGARRDDEVGVLALRGGDVIGEHTLIFAGAGERVELTHRAGDRSLFARGALRAARWIAGKPAGRYTMADVLGLR